MKSFTFALLLFTTLPAGAQTYWQQLVDTKIDVRLDDKKHRIDAYEEITYTNNSPDTLKSIYLHLWPNAYKHDHTPFAKQYEANGNTTFYYSKQEERGFIDSLDFSVDGQLVEQNIAENSPDITRIDLKEPLLPGHKVKITTPFMVKLPKVFSRLGHTDQAYYISQWFPKPAVYDRTGWHPISFLDQGEFYSEYGSYDVKITVPENYIVMATGNLLDERENAWLDSLSKLPLPADSFRNNTTIPSATTWKTLHYHEDNIHDFAWFADKSWLVRKDTVTVPATGLVVTTWAAFWPSYKKVWEKATDHLRETVLHYGKWVGPYQYKTIKAVLGDMRAGGGMEYPTITVIDKSARVGFRTVMVHEAGHNWFYGMLGSNERDHAWMDEGLNSFYEDKTSKSLEAEKGMLTKLGKLNEDLFYFELAATHNDQKIEQTSGDFTHLNYGLDVYYKSAMFFRMLEQYMGAADFEKGMRAYFDAWHFKHPYPEDFRVAMQKASTKQLDWFFDGMLNTDKKIDFAIKDARVIGSQTEVTIKNKSKIAVPVKVDAYKGDSLVGSVWSEPFLHKATISMPVTDWNRIKIDSVIPDAKEANDLYKKDGLFRTFSLKIKPVLGLNRSEQYKLFVAPALAYNQYDGIMAGLLLHDLSLPENRLRFLLAPMYSFGSNSFVGAGSVGYIWYPSKTFKEILLQGDAKTFHSNETMIGRNSPLYSGYTKAAAVLTFTLQEENLQSTVNRHFFIKGYNIKEDYFSFGTETKLVSEQKMYGMARYVHSNDRTYNPFSYNFEGQAGANFAKIAAEGTARIDYHAKNKSLYVRAYAGKFFAIKNDLAVIDRYKLNASYSAADDYLYDGTYIGRNARNNRAAQQISVQEGGFKIPVFNNVYRSDNWMATINISSDLPKVSLPIKLFFDAGLIPNFSPTISKNSATTLMYDGGIELRSIKDVVSIYIPLIMSGDFRDFLKNSYGNKHVFERSISFTLHLHNINWLRSPTKVLKTLTN